MSETRFKAIVWPPQIGDRSDCENTFAGYICTLNSGHEGPHAAHGSTGEVILTWSFNHEAAESQIRYLIDRGEVSLRKELGL